MRKATIEESAWFFEVKNNGLYLTDVNNKTWCDVDLNDEEFMLGINKFHQNYLNHLMITYLGENRVQCVVFNIVDQYNCIYGFFDYIKYQLSRITGYQFINISGLRSRGRSGDRVYYSMRQNLAHVLKQYDDLRNFIQGEKIFKLIFKHKPPKDIPSDAETIMIIDSYLDNLDFLEQCKNLKAVIIERSVIKNWEGLRRKTDIINLYIEASEVPDSRIANDMYKLQRVGMVDCSLRETEGLSAKKDLVFCDLGYNNFEKGVIMKPLFSSNKLRWLCLADSLISAINLQFWPELEVLEIQGNCMEEIYNAHFCKKLKFVDVTGNILEDIPGLNIENATILYELGLSYECK